MIDPGLDRIAVVTGGNKGIGLEVCRQLAGDGATVVLTARDQTRGAAAAEKQGSPVSFSISWRSPMLQASLGWPGS